MESYPTDKNELAKYLGGYPEYRITNRDADTPTDPILALKPLASEIVSNPAIRKLVLDALLILSNDQDYCWMAMYHILSLADIESISGVKLLSDEFLAQLRIGLFSHQAHLSIQMDWEGKQWPDGLWGDVRRLDNNLVQLYGVSVLSPPIK